ncbi:MAG TPA: hypothetical protein VJV03_16140 [Pyrinomonadaceae bacterium]|nr:hypothetical protein [Pyrinomonadaceae bacterium]
MKRIIVVVLLVGIAGIAGVVRSYTNSGHSLRSWPHSIKAQSTGGDVRDEIRKTVELSPGANVNVSGINGSVTIETSNTRTAEIYIERTADSQEALNRRKIVIEHTADSLTIKTEKDSGILGKIFGSNPKDKVTLRLPRQIALKTGGVNGSVKVGEIDGPVDISGVNGRVDVAEATGSANFSGINGQVSFALRGLSKAIDISGINGNIEMRLSEGVNADLQASGMNGVVTSELPHVVVDKTSRGNYTARIGSGGTPISASGINGNIRLKGLGKELKLASAQ